MYEEKMMAKQPSTQPEHLSIAQQFSNEILDRFNPEQVNEILHHIKQMFKERMLLSAGLSRQIMEATGRFQFIKEDPEMSIMTFWDNCWEKEYSIKTDWTLEKLMQWITNFYAEDHEWRGEQKAQRKMRSALGLD